MKLTHILAAVFGAAALAACQPAPAPDAAPETPAAETPAAETPVEEAAATPAALPCNVIDQRNWQASLGGGASPSLTISGQIDLGTPGFGVSLARDPAEASGATSATLTLQLRAPTAQQPQVVTPHPVNYFGPAGGQYTTVRIVCDGAQLTEIAVTR